MAVTLWASGHGRLRDHRRRHVSNAHRQHWVATPFRFGVALAVFKDEAQHFLLVRQQRRIGGLPCLESGFQRRFGFQHFHRQVLEHIVRIRFLLFQHAVEEAPAEEAVVALRFQRLDGVAGVVLVERDDVVARAHGDGWRVRASSSTSSWNMWPS
jgi:hypothetical protein